MTTKTVETHEADAIVTANGTVLVAHLPIPTGERVRVSIMRERTSSGRLHSAEEISRSAGARRALEGTVIRYDNPSEPVGVEDGDCLRGDSEAP
jgi:hypothetical protein